MGVYQNLKNDIYLRIYLKRAFGPQGGFPDRRVKAPDPRTTGIYLRIYLKRAFERRGKNPRP